METRRVEPEPTQCPKCGNEKRSRLRERGMIWCGECGWMEKDEESFVYKIAICPRCGRVPKARILHEMEDEKTLLYTFTVWTCCGVTTPVWPDQVEFWCHIYLAQSRRKEGKY